MFLLGINWTAFFAFHSPATKFAFELYIPVDFGKTIQLCAVNI